MRHWKALAGAGASTVLVAAADVAKPFPVKLVIDELLVNHNGGFALSAADYRVLAGIALLVIAIATTDAIASYWADVSLARAGERITHDLRVRVYAHLQRLSLAFHNRRQKGDLVARVTSDVSAAGTLFSDSLGALIQSALLLLGMMVVSFLLDPVLALVIFALTPVLGLMAIRYQRRIKALARTQRSHEGEIASLATEALASIHAVKALGTERFEHDRLSERSEIRRELGVEASRIEGRLGGLIDVLGAVATAVVIVVGVLRVAAGALSPGDLVVFAAYTRRSYKPLRDMARQAARMARATARVDRIAELLSTDESLPEPDAGFRDGRAAGGLELDRVSFAYDDGRPALKGVSLAVAAGSRVAIVGRSGAGKSTAAALVARFYDPESGRVLIDGRDARDCSLDWLRAQVGLVLQDTLLFSGTVSENIAYGTSATREEVIGAAKAAAAHDFIAELPHGYDTELGPSGVALSGGQRQRIGVARTLLRDPSILVLDEPTTGLDRESEAQVLAGLGTLMRGRTTLIITHSLSLASTAERVIVIDDGEVVEEGPPDELLATPGAFKRMAVERSLIGVR